MPSFRLQKKDEMEGMRVNKLRFGCQTYPWKMGRHFGELPHILDVAEKAGFQSLEAEIDMLGKWFDDPEGTIELFESHQMTLAALVLHQDWAGQGQTEKERELSDRAIDFVSRFPSAKLVLSHHAGNSPRPSGEALLLRRENLIACMNEVAVRAAELGIVAGFHPNSAANSLFRTEEDYGEMFRLLEGTSIGWVPDVGHMVNGGFDALEMMKAHRDLIRHVHFKDRNGQGEWSVMGEGEIDYPSVIAWLRETDYRGWIMVEDENSAAFSDSDAVVMKDGAYMRQFSGS